MSYGPRRSVTNEAAIRPHEHAFQRWSVPDVGEIEPQPFMTPASTERHDTMEAHMPSSFRVYQPSELRSAPMRRGSYHSIELEGGGDTIGARTLLKWTGIGIVAGLCVLAALILALNVGDDGKKVASTSARATIGKMAEPAPVPPPVKVEAKTPAVDIEIVTPPAPPPPAKKPAAKKTTASKARR